MKMGMKNIRIVLLLISINFYLHPSLLFAQVASGEPNGMGWKYIGNQGFTPDFAAQIDLIFDSTGLPYLSFIEFSTPQKPSVMSYSNSSNSWFYVGNSQFSYGEAMNLSMKLDKSGAPFVVFEDLQQNAQGAVFHMIDSIWGSADTISTPGNVFWMPSITFDTNNTLYVSYYNPLNYYIVVKKLIGGQWIDAGFPTDFIEQGKPTIYTKPNGELIISHVFWDAGVYKSYFFRYESDGWKLMPIGNILSEYLHYCKIYMSTTGEFYLAGIQRISNVEFITVQKLVGSTWHYVGNPQIRETDSYGINMAFNKFGQPYISFADVFNKVDILKYIDGYWESLDSTGNIPECYGIPYLAFNNENQLCIAFEDKNFDGKMSVMKYDTLYTGMQMPIPVPQSDVKIYPNPATTEIHIETKTDFDKVRIFNLMGQEVFCVNKPGKNFRIKTDKYLPGFYIAQFVNCDYTAIEKFSIR